MGWTEDYKEEDIVGDVTKPLKKLWDILMPESYPYVLKFKTNRATEVDQTKRVGPFSMHEHFIDYDCDVLVDNKPLIDIGWSGEPPNSELVKKAYGELYFHEMRAKMVEISKYAGFKFSQFDMSGKLNVRCEDLN